MKELIHRNCLIITKCLFALLIASVAACSGESDENATADVSTVKSMPISEKKVSTSVSRPAIDPQAIPKYTVDASWPKSLPNNWILGDVPAVSVDSHDHIWVLHRPRKVAKDEMSAVQNPPVAQCCVPAPSVIEFDQEGNVVQAWGGPKWNQETGEWVLPDVWPENEHGLFVDDNDNVWISGDWTNDHVVLKFTKDGQHLMTIGSWGKTGGSNSHDQLGRPADFFVDTNNNEIYVADGYGNRRIIVFDTNTGEYKRHWGAYGEVPHDNELPDPVRPKVAAEGEAVSDEVYLEHNPESTPIRSFRSPVHSVNLSNDAKLYVLDRPSNRIQAFTREGKFITEKIVAPETLRMGSVWDLAFSPDPEQNWLYIADGANMKVWVLKREGLEIVDSFGRGGRQAGQFNWVHAISSDSKGNLYTGEVWNGKRIQKFQAVAN